MSRKLLRKKENLANGHWSSWAWFAKVNEHDLQEIVHTDNSMCVCNLVSDLVLVWALVDECFSGTSPFKINFESALVVVLF